MGIKTVSSIIPVCPTVKNVLYPERYFFSGHLNPHSVVTTVGQKRFAGKMYAEEYVSLSWSPPVYGQQH